MRLGIEVVGVLRALDDAPEHAQGSLGRRKRRGASFPAPSHEFPGHIKPFQGGRF